MGIIDVTDPGQVNVENQAYPPPPGTSQGLPTPSFALGSAFGAYPIQSPSQGLPRPTEVNVSSLPAIQPSFSQGTTFVDPPETDVAAQNFVRPNAVDVHVTENGNFMTNNTHADRVTFRTTAVEVFDSGLPTEAFKITLALPVGSAGTINLGSYGLDLTGILASFPSSAAASSPENIPQRPIISYSTNWIFVYKYNSFGVTIATPGVGVNVILNILRDGAEVTSLTGYTDRDVFIAPAPPVAVTVAAPALTALGNLGASSGVVAAFVGGGTRVPLVTGTVEVANQSVVGRGLPTNVFQ